MAKDDNSSDLQKAEISIEDTIEAMKDGFVLYDKDDKLLMCNSAYKKQLGDGTKFVKEGRTYSEITRDMVSSGNIRGVDGNVDDYISKLEEQRKKNETFLNTIELEHGKWIQQSDSRAESGNLVGLRTDVTELKQREQELEEAKNSAEQAQNRLTNAINAMNEGFVIFDKEDRLAICNDAFREQFGEAAKFVIEGESYDDMTMNIAKSGIIPGIEGKEREFVDQLIEQRKSDTGFVKVFQRHDGEWIRQHDFRTEDGELVGIRANITELKKREEELEAASDLLEETTKSMVQGIAVFDKETLRFFNPTLLELLKLSEHDLKSGMSYDDYLEILKEKGHFASDDIIRKNKEMMLSGEKH
ncbi:MAG: PAS-domain containing protein, partial [Pseudomonadota bacterium]